MINHGLSTGALFLLVGMIYDRTHTRLISDYGGVAKLMPVFAACFLIVSLSSIGLPGLNGFIGEFMILFGAFQSPFLGTHAYTVFAALGIILSAVYMLWMYQRVMVGPVRQNALYGGHHLNDLSRREICVLVPVLIFIVWIGVYPKTFLRLSAPLAKQTIERVESIKMGEKINFTELRNVR